MTQAIGEAAEREQLGRYRRTYRPGPADVRRPLAEAVVLAAAIMVAAIGFVVGVPAMGVVGVVALLAGGAWSLWDLSRSGAVHRRESRLDLYEHGVVASGEGQVRVVRYDSTTVRRKIVHATKDAAADGDSYRYTIVDTDGAPVVLRHGIECPRQWGVEIEQGILQAQLPTAQAALDAGKRLDFAPMWLTARELGTGSESVPWSQIGDLAVVGGWLSVRVRGRAQPLESLPLCLMPNYVVFRALAERLHATSVSGAAG
ncbi:DUF6585 family protein [Nocardia macrotermitis]|uniref:DUF6585 family protein n=1 Tax=Nocardia macrotermitis TaxID=2585198 RepID=UPI001294C596|nr:DUF6585 family protein [Nocardia macrotermitis]